MKRLTLRQRVREAEILIAALLIVDEGKHEQERMSAHVRSKFTTWLDGKPVFTPANQVTGKPKIQLPPDSITTR